MPFSVPKYSVPRSISGEDSVRLGTGRDQRVRPFLAETATTRPPFVPLPRCRIVA